MLKAQATFCGSDTTSTSARSLAISARMRLSLLAAPSPASLMSRTHHGPGRRRRSVGPQRVDRVAVDPHQRRADRGANLVELVGTVGGVQPRIVAEPGVALEILLEPLVRRTLGNVLDGENLVVDLGCRLHRVAAVGEQHRAFVEHNRRAGRAGEAGEPGQPFLARRQIFVLLAVGARHEEAVEPAPLEFGAQARDASGAIAAAA